MYARLCRVLIVAVSIAVSTFLPTAMGEVSAQLRPNPTCPTGTNWDNITQTCH